MQLFLEDLYQDQDDEYRYNFSGFIWQTFWCSLLKVPTNFNFFSNRQFARCIPIFIGRYIPVCGGLPTFHLSIQGHDLVILPLWREDHRKVDMKTAEEEDEDIPV